MNIKCPKCGSGLTWGGDFDAEDYGLVEGIVSNFSCNCGVYAEQYISFDKEETNWIKYYLTKTESL